jgi:hypothetical protein
MTGQTETTDDKRKPWQFQPGNNANPKGRPKGARHKLGEAFLEALASDFEANGPQVIAEVRENRPADYLKVIASILPKEMNVKVDTTDELTDDQLDQRIRALADAIGIEVRLGGGASSGDGSEEASVRH